MKTDQKLYFSFVGGGRAVDVSGIFYVETERHKNIFYTAQASYRIYKKLDEIEKQLAPYGFVRVHRSFLVNMRYVQKISSYVLRLTNGTEISVPKSRYAYVKREYAMYREKWAEGGG